eukprot:scaffold772_cov236-Pinguiococcus_pyrenoidosus.AAC.5
MAAVQANGGLKLAVDGAPFPNCRPRDSASTEPTSPLVPRCATRARSGACGASGVARSTLDAPGLASAHVEGWRSSTNEAGCRAPQEFGEL